MNLNHTELIKLRKILTGSVDPHDENLMLIVDREIARAPEDLVVSARRTAGEVYYLSQRGVEERIREVGYLNNKRDYLTVIYCEHNVLTEMLFNRIVSLCNTASFDFKERSIVLGNAARIRLVGPKHVHSLRGLDIDLAIVLTSEDIAA